MSQDEIEAALKALNDPASKKVEAAAKFLARVPPGDRRIAPVLRTWIDHWLREYLEKPRTIDGAFTFDSETGSTRPTGTPTPANPESCILALGIHGSATDDHLLARFGRGPAVMARCRLLGRSTSRQTVQALVNWFGPTRQRPGTEISEYALQALLVVVEAAPDVVWPALASLLRMGKYPEHATEIVRSLLDASLPVPEGQYGPFHLGRFFSFLLGPASPNPLSASASQIQVTHRILRLILWQYGNDELPATVVEALRARGLPGTTQGLQEWLRVHPGSVAREELAARLAQLAESLAEGGPSSTLVTPLVPAEASYDCPTCGSRTLYVLTPKGLLAKRNHGDSPEFSGRVIEMDQLPEFSSCRKLVLEIGEAWLKLDESSLCPVCNPDAKSRSLALVIRHGDEPVAHRTEGVRQFDLEIIRAFLAGSEVYHCLGGGSLPLRKFIGRLRVLLGVPE